MENHVVIMAGGVGSRFWPISTPEYPKQFVDVLGYGKTMIQMTIPTSPAAALLPPLPHRLSLHHPPPPTLLRAPPLPRPQSQFALVSSFQKS